MLKLYGRVFEAPYRIRLLCRTPTVGTHMTSTGQRTSHGTGSPRTKRSHRCRAPPATQGGAI